MRQTKNGQSIRMNKIVQLSSGSPRPVSAAQPASGWTCRSAIGRMRRWVRRPGAAPQTCLTLAFVLATAVLIAPAQNSKPSAPQPAKPPSSLPSTLPPLQLDGDAALHHLNQVISWYRRATTGIQAVGLPSDTIYEDNTKNLAAQVVRFAFQSAKAEAVLIKAQQGSSQTSHESSQAQALDQMQAKTSSQIDQLQSQIDKLNGKIPHARPAQRAGLASQRDAVQSELDLQKALLEAIRKMTSFVETNGEAATGLEGGINQLARSIPEVLSTGAEKPAIVAAPAKPTLVNSGGLISEAIVLYDYMTAVHQIDAAIKDANETRSVADRVRTPLRDAMRATIQQSQNLAAQQPGNDPQQLQAERQNFQDTTERFKQLSAVLLPLSQEIIVLDDSKTNFGEWRSSVIRESRHVLRSVLVRVGGILG